MKYWIGIICIYFIAGSLPAQQYSVTRYSAVEGLPQSEVQALVEDAYGYLWLGTQGGGLARFDGRLFQVYTTRDGLLSNVIGNLFIDKKNNIWASHVQGITRFDGKRFTRFVKPDSLEIGRISDIVELQDTIFFTSVAGAFGKIYGDSVYFWNKPIQENSIYRLHQLVIDELCILLSNNHLIVHCREGTYH